VTGVQTCALPISKHLGVLKKVGLVSERREGRLRIYRLNGERLRPIHEWVKNYEQFWVHQLDRIKSRAEQKMQGRKGQNTSHSQEPKR